MAVFWYSAIAMKIYFAASIRAGREKAETHNFLVNLLSRYGNVLTEHIGDLDLSDRGEIKDSAYIFRRDMDWIKQADVLIAEVSTPSIGVGYEIRYAEQLGKRVICLYAIDAQKKLSAMVEGNKGIKVIKYSNISALDKLLSDELGRIK